MHGLMKPQDIEKLSFQIITKELGEREFIPETVPVIKRVIHTTADFDYADNLCFSSGAVTKGIKALGKGAHIVTDTHMAFSGINKSILNQLGAEAHCFISDDDVAEMASERGITRSAVSMEKAAKMEVPLIFAIGNAPTALIATWELIEKGRLAPEMVIGVPVGFVNVEQSKELFVGGGTPYIIARGRKGGSNVAAAIVNAMLYQIVKREGF